MAHSAPATAGELRPDVVVMDIRMPRLNGIDATREMRRTPRGPRVLVLTTFDLDEYVHEALRAGAGGFLLKDAPPGQLAEAVRTIARGDALLTPAVTRRLIVRFLRVPPPDRAARKVAAVLTERETEVLRQVAAGRSNAELAAHLHIAEATVKTHVSRVLTKLGLRDRVQAVSWAQFAVQLEQAGLAPVDDPGPGSVVTFDRAGRPVTLLAGAGRAEELVDAIEARLVALGRPDAPAG